MENNPWALDQSLGMQAPPQSAAVQAPPQTESGYPTMPNQYGLGSQGKKEAPQVNSLTASPWLFSGESNAR